VLVRANPRFTFRNRPLRQLVRCHSNAGPRVSVARYECYPAGLCRRPSSIDAENDLHVSYQATDIVDRKGSIPSAMTA
jgi:hypothetical protein